MSKSKNDIAWDIIFEKHKILEAIEARGRVAISASNINEFREARLMTKFDHKSQLPDLFGNHKLSILPTSRGGYEIGAFETFFDFDNEDVEITSRVFPSYLESIDYENITSEATAINCIFVSGILQDFTEEDRLFPTVSGRMGSSSFDFNINSSKGLSKIKVENSQIEIDGGYEGDRSLTLIEAKNYISDDFLIRQLFYPYRLWCNKIHKQVRPVFLTYSNGIFHLREYVFDDANLYNSIKLVKQKKYTVFESVINIESIQEILHSTSVVEEPSIPFPQADSFERVINLCEMLKQKTFLSKADITNNYDFTDRQTDYYINAAHYLGLVQQCRENNEVGCSLTQVGVKIFNLPIRARQLEFVKLILSHLVFKSVLKQYFDDGLVPSKEFVVEIMKRSLLYNVDRESTYVRRSSTIQSWINWIIGLVEE